MDAGLVDHSIPLSIPVVVDWYFFLLNFSLWQQDADLETWAQLFGGLPRMDNMFDSPANGNDQLAGAPLQLQMADISADELEAARQQLQEALGGGQSQVCPLNM